MEIRVFDPPLKYLGPVIIAVMFLPALALLLTIPDKSRLLDSGLAAVIGFQVFIPLVFGLFIQGAMNARVVIERAEGRVSRFNMLFSQKLFRRDFDLSRFTHVSLHRGARSGYCATLVSAEKEVLVSTSANLSHVRATAEEVATACGLKVKDSL